MSKLAGIMLLMLAMLMACVSAPNVGGGHRSEPGAVHLRWAYTTSEKITGFNVLRGDNEGGEHFQRVNSDPIPAAKPVAPAAATASAPKNGKTAAVSKSDYEFTDTSVDSGAEYYYYIESVDISGKSKPISPVVKRTAAARPPAPAPAR
jgi:hypothetical protein